MKLHNHEQGSPEWFACRAGKLTASRAQAIATAGKGLETLIYETLAEKHSSGEHQSFTNADIESGHELEGVARDLYEFETGNKVEQVGFIEMNEYVGCSPDGLIGEDGMLEIKSKKDAVYLRAIIESKIDSGYIWQCQMQLLVSGRKWVDFVDYSPNMKPNLNITRIYPDPEKQEKLKAGIKKGIEMMKEVEKKYNNLLDV